jgi:hypothetical protein
MRRPSNINAKTRKVPLSADELVAVLKEIEVILQSLHRVGSFYADDDMMCDRETARIIDDYRCAMRLAKARSILVEAMRRTLPQEDVATIEDALGRVRFWRAPKEQRI